MTKGKLRGHGGIAPGVHGYVWRVPTASEPTVRPAGNRPADVWWVLYDADCGLCAWAVARLLVWDRAGRLRPGAIQGADGQRLLADLDPQERLSAWHLIAPDGGRSSGGGAIAPLLRLLPGGAAGAAAVSLSPGLSERGYRWVAAHRAGLSRLLPGRAKERAGLAVERAEAGTRPGRPQ